MAGESNGKPKSGSGTGLPESDPTHKPFTPETLDRTIIAIPLLDKIEKDGPDELQDIIIDVNLEYPGGREKAREIIDKWVDELAAGDPNQDINRAKSRYSQQYLFGRLSGKNIKALVERDLNHWVDTGSGT